jgi:hypothetical protein
MALVDLRRRIEVPNIECVQVVIFRAEEENRRQSRAP